MPAPRRRRIRRGQAAVEAIALLALVLALVVGARAAVAGAAPSTARALADALPGPRHPTRGDRGALLGPAGGLARRFAPTIVLERDRYGRDRSAPVAFTTCRAVACADVARARPTAYVHVHRHDGATYLQYWLYYPDSQTDHLPIPALRGSHADDWEGVIVRVGADGRAAARLTAHTGFAGARPWWDAASGWRALAGPPVVFRASGSHADGFVRADIDLARDRWNGDLATVAGASLALLPADEAPSAHRRFSADALPPWRKAAWRDEDVAATSADGVRGRAARLAAAWAALVGGAPPETGRAPGAPALP